MWRSMEEVLRGLKEEGILEEVKSEKTEGGLPPGFRFHPTDEELVTYYLASKVFTSTTNTNNPPNLLLSNYYSGVQIAEVDLTRCEPWDLPERAKMGEREWYLYSLRDRKYPSGLRTNRATETGYWKATGKDRQVYASSITTTPPASAGAGAGGGGMLIGMKKTLVFYQGRAPRGVKTKWVMHEYRLDGHFSSFRLSSKEEWVICRIFHKNGDKKNPAIIHHHPPLPLSPFLSTLPPLQELKTSTTTTQTVVDNSLLHSLLSNPLTNFSPISGPDPIFPTTTTIATPADLPWSATATAAVSATKQQQNWLDRICPQVQIQYFQHQYQYHDHHHQPMNFDQTMDTHPHPNTDNYSTAAVTTSDNHDEEDTQVDTAAAAVHVDVDVSPSFAVAALDRMLNHAINYHPAESWSFHYP